MTVTQHPEAWKRAIEKLEIHYAGPVPGGVYTRLQAWIADHGEAELMEVLDEMAKCDRAGRPIRYPAKWIEAALANRGAIRAHEREIEPCSSCKDGFDEASRRCCSCPRGRERARNMRAALEREMEAATRSAKSIKEAEAIDRHFAGRFAALLKEVPRSSIEEEETHE